MQFFDTVPIGRIMNRFSRDQDIIDNLLMMEGFRMLFYWVGTALGTLIVIGVYNYWFTIAIPFILLFFYVTQLYYRRTSRELKRMDSITRSPLFAHFSETLTGLSTIRAYRQQYSFIHGNYDRMDTNDRPYYLLQCSSRWLGERLEFMGGCVTFLTAAIGVATRNSANPGVVGLSLSYALSLTQVLAFMVRNIVDTENNMNSVERSKSYAEHIEQEAPAVLPDDSKIPPEWPQEGTIQFQDLSIRYRAGLPLVLKQITFSVAGGERIGVVGRTGAVSTSCLQLF
jgi:ABC-type multidrug transport system fused ATPase/permease subunit